MSVYNLVSDSKSRKNDGKESVYKMNEEELFKYLEEQRENFLMSVRTIGTVIEDDEELKLFVEGIEESTELLTKKEYDGLIKNIKNGRVETVYGKDITQMSLTEQLKLAKGCYYVAWAIHNKKEAQSAKKLLKRNFEELFKGSTTLDDWD